MVLKTTFGQSQRWSLIRDILGVENEEKNNLNFANKVFNKSDVLILGGLNSRIPLYIWYKNVQILEKYAITDIVYLYIYIRDGYECQN